jgi:hypothetical protein
MSGFNGDGQQRVCLRANLVCSDCPDGVDQPRVVPQAVDFFPGAVDPEFAVVFDEGGTAQVEKTQAVADNVCLQN